MLRIALMAMAIASVLFVSYRVLDPVQVMDLLPSAVLDAFDSNKTSPRSTPCARIPAVPVTTDLAPHPGAPPPPAARDSARGYVRASNECDSKAFSRYDKGILTIAENVGMVKVSTVSFDIFTEIGLGSSGTKIPPYRDPAYQSMSTPLRVALNATYVGVVFDGLPEERHLALETEWQPTTAKSSDRDKPSILLLVVDSMSRETAKRLLPKTMDLLAALDLAFVFDEFGSTGFSTMPSMTPVLMGRKFDVAKYNGERIRTRRNDVNPEVDPADYVTRIAQDRGYRTIYGADVCYISFMGNMWWSRENQGFGVQIPPVTQCPHAKGHYQKCAFGPKHFQHYLGVIDRAFDDPQPTFYYQHLFIGHDKLEIIGQMDADIALLIESVVQKKVTVVFMGDHGKNGISGKDGISDSITPFLSMILPPNTDAGTLSTNTRILTSPWDLHMTLLGLVAPDLQPTREFGLNLMTKQLSMQRTCAEAGIPLSRCTHTKWKHLEGKDVPPVLRQALVEAINVSHHQAPSACHNLTLAHISQVSRAKQDWKMRLETNEEALVFLVEAKLSTRDEVVRLTLSQQTRYQKYEVCTPKGVSAKFCLCDIPAAQ